MENLTDIYLFINLSLIEKKYYSLSRNEQVVLVNEELKKYVIYKIKLLSKGIVDESLELSELVKILANYVDVRDYKTIDQLTHFLLGIMGTIQGKSITWYCKEEEEYINNPKVEIENCRVTNITTHFKNDSVYTFNFLLDYYTNYFVEHISAYPKR